MERVKYIPYKEEQILYIDFSDCNSEEIITVIKAVKEKLAGQEKKSVLTLTNVNNAHYGLQTLEVLKQFVLHNKPYVKKAVVIGLNRAQGNILNDIMKFSGRHISVFDDIEQAKDWLVDRREFIRIHENIKMEYSVLGHDNIQRVAVGKNISMGGIAFTTDIKLERTNRVFLKLYLFNDIAPLEIKGMVTWVSDFVIAETEKSYTVGVQFFSLSEYNHKKLFDYVLDKYGKYSPD